MSSDDILGYYRGGQEEQRLSWSLGRLEQLRTQEILGRVLPPAPSRVLDVGGGTGVYALPLADAGYQVDLVDPVPVHIERALTLSREARAPLRSATEGDARHLDFADATFAAVMMLGPLYHLVDAAERVQALVEARRVLAPGGVLVSAYISRFASTLDGLKRDTLRDPAFAAIVDGDLTTGQHRNPTNRVDYFTTAYFHHPSEIAPELARAGFETPTILAVEGPAWIIPDLDSWLDTPALREQLLDVLRRVEAEPSLLGSTAHLLAISRKSA